MVTAKYPVRAFWFSFDKVMAKAIPTPYYTTFFCARKTLRVFLIGRKKMSVT